MKRALALFISLLLCVAPYGEAMPAEAQSPKPTPVVYDVMPLRSWLKFEATQKGIMVGGQFKKFALDIVFHPENPEESRVKVVVDLSSIASSSEGMAEELAKPEWLNITQYTQAIFETKKIMMVSPNHYLAEGSLTLKGITQPVKLNFMYEDGGDGSAVVLGSGTLQRTKFDVGSGQWTATDVVKDAVLVHFRIEAGYSK